MKADVRLQTLEDETHCLLSEVTLSEAQVGQLARGSQTITQVATCKRWNRRATQIKRVQACVASDAIQEPFKVRSSHRPVADDQLMNFVRPQLHKLAEYS